MAKKLSPFEEAFKEARADGRKTFTFNGKSYGTTTSDEVTAATQKRVDAIPARVPEAPTGIQAGTRYVNFPHTPTPSANEKSLMDKYRESDMAKGFRDARATFGDTPSTDMLMNAGKIGIAAMPVGRALSAANKYLTKKDSPAGIIENEEPALNLENMIDRSRSEPAFNPDKMVDRRSTTFPGRSEPKFNPDKITGRDQPEPAFNPEKMTGRERPEPMKKGGVVKKMASGGKVSSASSRGDGIAQRGKTKGRMC
jgi:hypothetical protein